MADSTRREEDQLRQWFEHHGLDVPNPAGRFDRRRWQGRPSWPGPRRGRFLAAAAAFFVLLGGGAIWLQNYRAEAGPAAHHSAPVQQIGEPWVGSGRHVTLRLNGQPAPPGTYPAPVRGAYRVTLPLVPGAARVARDIAVPVLFKGAYFRRGVSRAYRASMSPRRATSWVEQRLSDLGYVMHGVTTLGDATEFGFGTPSGRHDLEVTVGIQTRRGATVMEYWVVAVAVPPRPAASLIRRPIRSVVMVVEGAGGQPSTTRRIADPAEVRAFVHALNALPLDWMGGSAMLCPAPSTIVTFRIVLRSGTRYQVTDAGCDVIRLGWSGRHGHHIILYDKPVWGRVLQALDPPGPDSPGLSLP